MWKFTERDGGRTAIAGDLTDTLRSHCDELDRIAEDIRELGFAGASAILAERFPRTARARSGELGEIRATELVEEELGFEVPVRRLRYKDGREMALRGDDFIGVLVEGRNQKSCGAGNQRKCRAFSLCGKKSAFPRKKHA